MSCTRLSGIRCLDEVHFHEDVVHAPGVYIFYKTITGPPRYVGRSDISLYNRIRGRNYLYYKYKHCDNDVETYYWECIYWHRYQDTIENSYKNGGSHPAKPIGINIPCPVCGQ